MYPSCPGESGILSWEELFESIFGNGIALVGIGIFIFIWLLLALIPVILMIISQWRLFVKAGEAGWAALIPFYNSYVMYKISCGNGLYFLLTLIPVAGPVFDIIMHFRMARSFGKSVEYGIGLWLLPIVFYPMLAFGKSEYTGAQNGLLD